MSKLWVKSLLEKTKQNKRQKKLQSSGVEVCLESWHRRHDFANLPERLES